MSILNNTNYYLELFANMIYCIYLLSDCLLMVFIYLYLFVFVVIYVVVIYVVVILGQCSDCFKLQPVAASKLH